MKLHCHITLPRAQKPPRGWKKTEIVLANSSMTQTDYMVTKHFAVGRGKFKSLQDITDYCVKTCASLGGIRVKLEQESDFHLPITDSNYVELHLKVNGEAHLGAGWANSMNPNEQVTGQERFYSKRIRSGSSVYTVVQTERAKLKVPYVELKVEHVIYDSNPELDSWWA